MMSERQKSIFGWWALIALGIAWVGTATDPRRVLPEAPKPKALQQQQVKPFSERMGCEPWRPGLSRTVTITATEDPHGMLSEVQCHRYREKGKVSL